MSLMIALVEVLHAWKTEGDWSPRAVHLSMEDWWSLREEIVEIHRENPPKIFFSWGGSFDAPKTPLSMEFRGVLVCADPKLPKGGHRFEPIPPTSVGARMIGPLLKFRGGILGTCSTDT